MSLTWPCRAFPLSDVSLSIGIAGGEGGPGAYDAEGVKNFRA